MYKAPVTHIAMGEFGQVFPVNAGEFKTHSASACKEDEFCVIHKPSPHHMREWRITLRLDKDALAERVCSHGVGHPDPDSLAYLQNVQGYGEDMGVHGCCGCCKVTL